MSVTSALRECHRLRVHLRNLQAEIDRGPRVLKGYQDDLGAARQAHKEHYAAKQHEIEMARARKGELEDAILATIMELEERTAAVPAAEAAWAQAQADFQQLQVQAAERVEAMKADQAACTAELAKVEGTLPADVKRTYDTVVKSKGPDAFAAAKARVCQACRTGMTEGQFGALQGGTFRTCASCGRIQYPVECRARYRCHGRAAPGPPGCPRRHALRAASTAPARSSMRPW